MMCTSSRVWTIYLLQLLFITSGSAQILGLVEGAGCGRGTCRRLSSCAAAGDFRQSRPQICSFDGPEPVVCCPELRSGTPASPAVRKCQEYDRMACNAVIANRRKRRSSNSNSTSEEEESSLLFRMVDWMGAWMGIGEVSSNEISSGEAVDLKVIGGTEAKPRELPFMALVGYGLAGAQEWSCGGSIVSERYVLSAAHCASSSLGVAKWVRVGELVLSESSDEARPLDVPIVERIVHPQYKEPAVYNDIALFRLAAPLSFSQYVQPLCLHPRETIQEPKALAAGWGRVDFVGPTSDKLMKVDLSLVEGSRCRSLLGRAGRYLPQGVDQRTQLCAGEAAGGKDTCTGDSGGPLVVGGGALCLPTQIGIVSFGRQCALPNTPGIYTRISYFLPWIETVVWPN